MFKKLLLTTAICTVCSPALAQTYHLTAPLLPAHQAEGDHLKVTLGSLKLPDAKVGYLYQVDLRPLARATGTLHFDVKKVTWGIGGELPEGLTFANGIISGIPEEIGNKTVTVAATYKHATGTKNYTVPVTLAVALANAELPEIGYGQSPNFDFKPLLSIDDPSFDSSLVGWSINPTNIGLSIENGVLQGSLTAQSVPTLQISAAYKGTVASNTYALPTYPAITTVNGYRQWSDGTYASSCKEYLNPAGPHRYAGDIGDGAYMLSVAGSTFPAWCDMTTDGGGWTVFQRRFNGSVNFYRGIAEYRAGFGNVNGGEYWLGLVNLNKLAGTPKELRVDLGRYTGQRAYAKYRNMVVGGAPNYIMQSLSFVEGTAGDSMTNGNLVGRGFSTYDYELDTQAVQNCAAVYRGAWWYESCHSSNLNGAWLNGPHSSYADGIEWFSWTGHYESLTFTEMKVR